MHSINEFDSVPCRGKCTKSCDARNVVNDRTWLRMRLPTLSQHISWESFSSPSAMVIWILLISCGAPSITHRWATTRHANPLKSLYRSRLGFGIFALDFHHLDVRERFLEKSSDSVLGGPGTVCSRVDLLRLQFC